LIKSIEQLNKEFLETSVASKSIEEASGGVENIVQAASETESTARKQPVGNGSDERPNANLAVGRSDERPNANLDVGRSDEQLNGNPVAGGSESRPRKKTIEGRAKARPRKQPVEGKAKARPRKQPVWKEFLFLTIKVTVILLAFVLLFTFLFGIERYSEPSMAPAIKDGDLAIYYRYTKVGFLPQDTIMLEHNGQKHARRVIATAGDIVDITERGVYINGSLQQETEIYQRTERYEEGIVFPMTVPDGHVFVLGDSRVGATDSRVYGSVDIDEILGKVIAVIRRRSI